jgi:hypothetical protein
MAGQQPIVQKPQRPGGITILALVYLFLAVLSIIWSLLVFGVGGFSWLTGTLFGAEGWQSFGSSSTWSATLSIIAAVVQLIVAFGLLGLKRWAWYLALVAIGLTVVTGLLGLFGGGLGAFICGGIGLVIPIGILIYLIMPNVRSVFGV